MTLLAIQRGSAADSTSLRFPPVWMLVGRVMVGDEDELHEQSK